MKKSATKVVANEVAVQNTLGTVATRGKTEEQSPSLISVKKAATLCGISVPSFYRLDAAGKIGPQSITLGGRRLFRLAELEQWIAAGCPDREQWRTRRNPS